MYAITAQIGWVDDKGYTVIRELPTFYLDENVQGIASEAGAQLIAWDIVDPRRMYPEVHIAAVKIR